MASWSSICRLPVFSGDCHGDFLLARSSFVLRMRFVMVADGKANRWIARSLILAACLRYTTYSS